MALERADVPAAASVARLSREQSRKLIMLIKNLPLTIAGTEGFGKAMVARTLDEVCPKTLEPIAKVRKSGAKAKGRSRPTIHNMFMANKL